jgi:hypothetical protein
MPPVAMSSCNVNLPNGPGPEEAAELDLLNRPNTELIYQEVGEIATLFCGNE